jgi:N-methylhydantoinase A
MTGFVIGIDVGGTFTDVVCSDGTDTWRAKAPTNPERFSDGVLAGCELIAAQLGLSLGALLNRTARFGLGTTAVLNMLATRRGLRVGLLTTAGFEEELHRAKNKRIGSEGWLVSPWIPVDVSHVRGVTGRIDRAGTVLVPLDDAQLRATVDELVNVEGVEAIAVSFLWSFKNSAHEAEAAAVIRSLYPHIPVFCGAELRSTIREFERTTLAVLNAYTANSLDGVEELESELKARGLHVPLLLLHSGGGAIAVKEAKAAPIGLASSGPAAGAVAAAEIAGLVGTTEALCCDMGGTSIDVALIQSGVPERRERTEIEGLSTALPSVDVESIGAGGGSIAWIDSRGLLRVGPMSARATPGPVCYGRGGTEPTVTDAMVVLGFIDPSSFMGGRMTLDVEGAQDACARLGRTLGFNAVETAHGIREIALAEMGKAIRARVSKSGIDARKFSVVSYGGSGSLFVPAIARELGFSSVITPSLASVLSAYGAATADIRREAEIEINALLPFDDEELSNVFARLTDEGNADLARQEVSEENRLFEYEVDLRFHRQKTGVTLPVQLKDVNSAALGRLFETEYRRRYGEASLVADTLIELSSVRVIGVGKTVRGSLPRDQASSINAAPREQSRRSIWLERNAPTFVPVYHVDTLALGDEIIGPALLDAVDTTLWLPENAAATVAKGKTLITKFHPLRAA